MIFIKGSGDYRKYIKCKYIFIDVTGISEEHWGTTENIKAAAVNK